MGESGERGHHNEPGDSQQRELPSSNPPFSEVLLRPVTLTFDTARNWCSLTTPSGANRLQTEGANTVASACHQSAAAVAPQSSLPGDYGIPHL
jgi:hypothetical protein